MALNFQAGRLRHRVAVQGWTDTPDGAGGFVRARATVMTVWAEVMGMAGREAMMAGALNGVTPYRITIRWRDDITTSHQLLHEGERLNIRSINDPDGRRRWLTLICDNEGAE